MKKKTGNRFIATLLMMVLCITSSLNMYQPGQTVILHASDAAPYQGNGFEIVFLLDSSYHGGFQARVQIRNTGKETIHNWMLRMQYEKAWIQSGMLLS